MGYTYDPTRILRASAQEQRQVYREYREAVRRIRENPFYNPKQIEEAQAQASNKLKELLESHTFARDTVNNKAAKRKAEATPEASEMIRRRLANGYDFYSLLEQLTKEQDRAGLSALVKELPDLARAGQLPDDGRRNIDRMIREAQNTIAEREATLYDDQEKAIHNDAREVGMNFGMLEANHKKLNEYLEQEQVTGYRGRRLNDNLYHWQGLPDSDLPKGLLPLEEYSAV